MFPSTRTIKWTDVSIWMETAEKAFASQADLLATRSGFAWAMLPAACDLDCSVGPRRANGRYQVDRLARKTVTSLSTIVRSSPGEGARAPIRIS